MQKQSLLLEELTNCKSVVWQESFKKKGLVNAMNGALRSGRMRRAGDFQFKEQLMSVRVRACVCVCVCVV